MNVSVDINVGGILAERGLGSSHDAQIVLANTVERLSQPYTPRAPAGGRLSNSGISAADGSSITYPGPYAKFQWHGVVMVGTMSGSPWAKRGEPKVTTGKALQHHGAPMRGPKWVDRMMADRGAEVRQAVAKRVGGKPK